MDKLKVSILGAGRIAATMAETLAKMDDVISYSVAARDLDRAQAFAEKYGFEKAYGSYEEMLQDDGTDLVYIATPHSHHYEHALLCLNHGRSSVRRRLPSTANRRKRCSHWPSKRGC